MHELSIARSILDIAVKHADGKRVTVIHVKSGYLRQVVPSALCFNFDVLARGTPAEGAALDIEVVPAVTLCLACGAESRQESFPFECRSCEGRDLQVVAGEELMVESLEMEARPSTGEHETAGVYRKETRDASTAG